MATPQSLHRQPANDSSVATVVYTRGKAAAAQESDAAVAAHEPHDAGTNLVGIMEIAFDIEPLENVTVPD